MSTTATKVADELKARGYRADVHPADPPNSNVACVNVWRKWDDTSNPRRPADTLWEPFADEGWTWGPCFEHKLLATASTAEVVDKVIATVLS